MNDVSSKGFLSNGLHEILGYTNVFSDNSIFDKGTLLPADEIRWKDVESVGDDFEEDFIGNIAEAYGSEVAQPGGFFLFWYQVNIIME